MTASRWAALGFAAMFVSGALVGAALIVAAYKGFPAPACVPAGVR